MNITILRESEIRQFVSLDYEVLEVVEDAFCSLARGEAKVPPIIGVEIPESNGEVDVKTAYIRGLDSFAIKIASGFYNNGAMGLPTSSGMMILISTKNGFPQAVMLDNGYLTQVRTGAAGAIAAKYLAPKNVETVGVIGSGTQARYQVQGLCLVRNFRRLLVYGIIDIEVDRYIQEMTTILGIDVIKVQDVETVVRNSQVIVTTTPSQKPYLKAEWLHSGMHITAMGADSPDKEELYPAVVTCSDRVICDSKAQCFIRGELHHALDKNLITEDSPIGELGEITSGLIPGRTSQDQITLCDLTGVGVQDTAIARLAYQKAIRQSEGISIGV